VLYRDASLNTRAHESICEVAATGDERQVLIYNAGICSIQRLAGEIARVEMFMTALSLLFGILIGLSLGLTGGGGAIFAVPLLVYGLGVSAKDALVTSLAAVGTISAVGFLTYWKRGHVELRTGFLFAAAGMLGAPAGTWIASLISESVLLLLFAGLMTVVAVRLWQQAASGRLDVLIDGTNDCRDAPTCQRDAAGELMLTSRCAILLVLVGVVAGALSGLFGVGGGFIIVPALVLFSGMAIHRAVGTSLLVIVLVSAMGLISHWYTGRTASAAVTFWFVLGGTFGLLIGQQIGRQLPASVLQKVFAFAILVVALLVIVKNAYV